MEEYKKDKSRLFGNVKGYFIVGKALIGDILCEEEG
jgi:hypothetical protein